MEIEILEELLEREANLSEDFSPELSLRIHRSLSWLKRGRKQAEDADAAFIFYWVAFNALYGSQSHDDGEYDNERRQFRNFFDKISSLDSENTIYNELWKRFSDSVRVLMQNKYVFQPFWNYVNGVPGYADWELSFDRARELGNRAMANEDTTQILCIIFDRLYVLRNQVFHGAATWQSSVNRAQIEDARRILAFLVPLFVDLMMRNHHVCWGSPGYAVLNL